MINLADDIKRMKETSNDTLNVDQMDDLIEQAKPENILFPVVEIFESIQGEGNFMGIPCTFVRFAGCNLACPWCDTKESWEKPSVPVSGRAGGKHYRWETLDEIVENCTQKLVIFTGGEPCLQEHLSKLIFKLHFLGHYTAIETNGTLPYPEGIDHVTVSPKPGAKYVICDITRASEIKYVVSEEFDPHDPIIYAQLTSEYMKAKSIWLQPEGSDMVASWKKATRFAQELSHDPKIKARVRVGVQLHKILEVK